MFKPLEGVKVIDLTYFVAGPGAAKILADWGADVIKVEPSFGDPGRGTGGTMNDPTEKDCNPFYTAYNANKRGLSLNLKAQEGKDILDKLLETADVFITSYRTGALVRLGLDYDTLSKKHPHIIWAQINGFGDFGPAKDNHRRRSGQGLCRVPRRQGGIRRDRLGQQGSGARQQDHRLRLERHDAHVRGHKRHGVLQRLLQQRAGRDRPG